MEKLNIEFEFKTEELKQSFIEFLESQENYFTGFVQDESAVAENVIKKAKESGEGYFVLQKRWFSRMSLEEYEEQKQRKQQQYGD